MLLNKIRFSFLAGLKLAGYIFYPSKLHWIGKKPKDWNDISLILILNHTSLFEFVYGVALPFDFLKVLASRLVIPVADKTMDRPVSGFIFKYLAPHTIKLTRKRDNSWQEFLNKIESDKVCIFMPEGQMKRKNGLDKKGNEMQVKTGVYELMQKYRGKKMVFVYSHGLHHILAPGDKVPKLFKKVEADIEMLCVDKYLSNYEYAEDAAKLVAKDLQLRRDKYCKN